MNSSCGFKNKLRKDKNYVRKQNITLARADEFSYDERKEINKEACKVVSENNGILDYENAFYYYGDDD